MRKYSDLRSERPGVWLSLALAVDLLTYATGADAFSGTWLWVALSVWLAHRIWRGGATALAWYRGLQTFCLCLFAIAFVAARLDDAISTGATASTLVLYGLSVWFLLAPALSRHVDAAADSASAMRTAVEATSGPVAGR